MTSPSPRRTSLRLFACLVALAAAHNAAPAAAQDAEERPTLKLGPIEFRPRLLFSNIGVDNNVFNEPTNAKSDFTATATPDLEVSMHPGRLRVVYTTGSQFVYFRKYKSERSVNRNFTGRADLDLTYFRPFASISAARTRERANSEIDLRARHHPRVYAAGTSVRIASRTSLLFTARRSSDDYADGIEFRGVDLATVLDSKTTGYDTALNIELTPLTTFSLGVSKEEQRFARSPVRDSDSLRVAPTLTISPLGLLTGTVSVGYRRFDGLDPALPDYTGIVANGTLGVLLAERYRLATSFTRDVRYSYEEANPYYIITGGRATLTAQTYGPLDIRILGGREALTYRALAGGQPAGTDRQIVYGGGVGYRITGRVRIVIDAEASRRRSDRNAAREYTNHRIVGALNWGALNR